jgi:hypothetical protein
MAPLPLILFTSRFAWPALSCPFHAQAATLPHGPQSGQAAVFDREQAADMSRENGW